MESGSLAAILSLSLFTYAMSYTVHWFHADGTLAERVVLGKRRREQLGIQTESDKQHLALPSKQQPHLTSQSSSMAWAFSGNEPAGQAGSAVPGPAGSSGPGIRLVAPAESMMTKWGYTPGQIHAF